MPSSKKPDTNAIEEVHLILGDAYHELEPVPEAVQGIAQALSLARYHEALHREGCKACQKGQTCPRVLTLKETAHRLITALEIISRHAEFHLGYVRDAVGLLGEELYGEGKPLPEGPRGRLLTLVTDKSKRKKKSKEEGEDEPAS